MDPIPTNRAYQVCYTKNPYGKYEEVHMLLDDNFLFFLKIDAKSVTHSRGIVHTKIKQKDIVRTYIDAKDSRVLTIAILSDQNQQGFIER